MKEKIEAWLKVRVPYDPIVSEGDHLYQQGFFEGAHEGAQFTLDELSKKMNTQDTPTEARLKLVLKTEECLQLRTKLAEKDNIKREVAESAVRLIEARDERIKKLEADLKLKTEALVEIRKNSRHDHTCDIMSMDAECSCGYNKAIQLYDAALGKL